MFAFFVNEKNEHRVVQLVAGVNLDYRLLIIIKSLCFFLSYSATVNVAGFALVIATCSPATGMWLLINRWRMEKSFSLGGFGP